MTKWSGCDKIESSNLFGGEDMKVLVINGSPKGKNSNTYKLTKAFVAGMKQAYKSEASFEMEEIYVNQAKISPCLGCFSCWNKTPGKCCISDDMQQIIERQLQSDIIIWSFPLYYFSVPGGLKNLIDRQLPMVLPFMEEREDGVGSGSHPSRYDMSGKRHILISTCGFYTAKGNYDSVLSMFDHMCGKEKYTTIFCGQGELFRVPEVSKRTNEYLEYVKCAGEEYINGGILEPTRAKLDTLLYPKETFEAMADASWGIEEKTGERADDSLIFTKQMAALYRKEAYPGKDLVVEMCYTDVGKTYQILLGKDGSKVFTDNSKTSTTRIETPFTVWKSIAMGEISGAEALMKSMYKVKGDFNLMLHWDDYFGSTGSETSGAETSGKEKASGKGAGTNAKGIHMPVNETNMNIMLIPWIIFWVTVAIQDYVGSLISIGVSILIPLIFYKNKKTFYDTLTGVLVTGFSIINILGVSTGITMPLSYLAFGAMWTVTCFGKIPLTAHYSMNQYGNEKALENPMFIKTNRILTFMWGILYVLTSIWTYFLMGTGFASFTGAINSVVPAFMGIFTVWFQKWYPAKLARG